MMMEKVSLFQLWKIVINAGLAGLIALGAGSISGIHATRAAISSFIVVNTVQDEMAVDGNCSLREAIRAANLDVPVDACPAGSGADTVYLPAGIYKMSIAGAGENEGLTGDLDILSDLTITGSGEGETVVDGASLDRIFHIIAPINTNIYVKIANLTIRNGSVKTAGLYGGGGILNQSGDLTVERCVLEANHAVNTGGGIDNHNDLTVDEVTFSQNQADVGAGLFNDGQLSVLNSTFTQNTANHSGGGLDNNADGVTIQNSTFSGNSANQGGGLFSAGEMTLLNLTIVENSTGLNNNGVNPVRIKNSIIALSTAGNDCIGGGPLTTQGNNIDSDNSCNFNLSNDQHGVDPQIEALGDNGGPTLTHALKAGSPAIDQGDNTDCPQTDQRGAFRPADGDGDQIATCDVGAVEFNASFPKSVNLPLLLR
jgi:CSLREA domain-containing protein